MAYEPGAIVTYGAGRLVPAPQITVNTEPVYANETLAGYSYVITLSGYATALDLVSNTNDYGLKAVSDKVQVIRDIFSVNGEGLIVKDKDDKTIMECRGGTIKSISFDESSNNWVNYAPYKIEIEFNEIIITGCNISNAINCNTLTVDATGTAPNLIDLTKYKIKSFNDSWSFNIPEAAYNNYGVFKNQYVEIEYKVSAVGKHFYNDNKKLLPSWEQAKNFVQDRVYSQVSNLIDSVLNRTSSDDGCSGGKPLSDLHELATPGGIDGIDSGSHKIYNETISCETSEAEGSFSATYKSILKFNSTDPLASDCIHTFNKNKSVQKDGRTTNISVSVQGEIKGLIPGGLINSPNSIQFPANGRLFIANNNTGTKYDKALVVYNLVHDSNSDLSSNMKSIMDITPAELGVGGACSNTKPASFSATHSYADGSISYSAEYNSNRACSGDKSYRNISITVEEGVPLVAEFVVPGRANGPIIQRIGPKSPKKISVNIEGVSQQLCCADIASNISGACSSGLSLPSDIPPATISGLKLVQNQETLNRIDGSYNISRSYISPN